MMEALAQAEVPLNRFCTFIEELETEDERRDMRRAIGTVLAKHFSEVMPPIIREHPELDPDNSGNEWYNSVKKQCELALKSCSDY